MTYPALLSGVSRVLLWLTLALVCSMPVCGGREAFAREGLPTGAVQRQAPAVTAPGADRSERASDPRGRFALGALIVLEALVIIGLLRERASRRRAELSLAGRLRFEELLSDLSARLIPVSLRDVDAEIVAGLARVVKFLRVDRGSLDVHVPGGPDVRIARVGGGAPPGPTSFEADRFPWTAARLRQGHVVKFSSPGELPDDAALDREEYRKAGILSCLALPLRANGHPLGVLTFDGLAAQRSWSPEVPDRLERLGAVFTGALERKRLELALAERLRFETLLSEQSATFSSLSATEIDREIERALRRIADFFKADWGSLAEFSNDARVARVTHSWVAEGAAPSPATVSLAEIPWAVAGLARGEVIRFSRIDDLPEPEAAVDRRTHERLGVKAQVQVPLRAQGALLGALTFSTLDAERPWPDVLVQRLQLLGEVFANILSRRQAETETQQLRQALGHVGRISTLGALTTSLTHELNQPLMAILNNAEAAQSLLQNEAVDLGAIAEILEDIVQDDVRASQVIQRLRGLLKKGDVEITDLDLNEVVGEVARLVSGDAVHRNVAVRLDLTPGLPPVTGDRVQLQQVVLNLILNALDAIRDSAKGRGTVVLRTSAKGAGAVCVAVQDSGGGIGDADPEQIFSAFYTTKAAGLGVGLAIARSIVEMHRGQLEACNNAEGGATFSFTLPAGPRAD